LLPLAALTGVVAGLGLLVRADAVTLAPAVGLAFWWSPATARRRVTALAVATLTAATVFAPWPLRNLRRFGATHATAAVARTIDGVPLPDEIVEWERTWATSAAGESYLDLPFVYHLPLDPRRLILPEMYDDARERQRIAALFVRYNHEQCSDAVIHEFAELARQRRRQHPARTYLVLPLLRIFRLWSPIPEWELPMRAKLLGLPRLRWLFGYFDLALYLCAAFGAVVLYRSDRANRQLLALLGSAIIARSLLFSMAIPIAATQRYLVEAFPILIALAAYGLFRGVGHRHRSAAR
jgi:hypothetical protein